MAQHRRLHREWRLRTSACVLVSALLFPSIACAVGGYTSRRCGFDLNADGVIGSPEDCNICSGKPVPDRNEIYVDCQGGSDTRGAGTPGAPFKSIQHAFDASRPGVQNVVCFKGVCSEENLTPKQSGLPGSYTRDGFEFPVKPAMLVGWDANGNGDYPPHDKADVAVLDGGGRMHWAIDNRLPVGSMELAHFTARNYTDGSSGGFMKMAHSTGSATHIYLHDLSLRDINRGQPSSSSDVIVFNFFIGASWVRHVAIVNAEIIDYGGGYAIRGAGDNSRGDNGPFRFQNLTIRSRGQGGGSITGVKLWDMITGVEVLDSSFDANPGAWNPGNGPTTAIHACNCTRQWRITRNEFRDYKQTFVVDPDIGAQFCTVRPMDDVVFDGNIIRNTYPRWRSGTELVQILAGADAKRTVNNVTITRNSISSTSPVDACIWSNAGNDAGSEPGTIKIAGNTCSLSPDRFAAIVIGPVEGRLPAFPHQRYVIADNVISGLAPGKVNIGIAYAPAQLSLNGNTYDPRGGFAWNTRRVGSNNQRSFAEWRTASGEGRRSKLGTPSSLKRPH